MAPPKLVRIGAPYCVIASVLASCTAFNGKSLPPDAGTPSDASAANDVGAGPVLPAKTLATIQGPRYIALLGDDVYFTGKDPANGNGAVFRVPKVGGSPIALAPNEPNVNGIAVDAHGLFWNVGEPTPAIRTCTLPNCNASTFAPTTVYPYGLAIDDALVVWVVSNPSDQGGGVYARARDGSGDVITIGSEQPYAHEVAIDGSDILWTVSGPTAGVWRSPKSNPSPVLFAAGNATHGIALSSTEVFYSNAPPTADGSIQKKAKAGGEVSTLLTGLMQPELLATDGTSLYIVETGDGADNGRILKCPVDKQCTPTVIASGQAKPKAIAIDDANVYWTNEGNGEVHRAPK